MAGAAAPLYGGLLHFERLGEEAFNALLARRYDAGANGSALIVEHLDGDQALASVTAALPEPEDLLETADEAPIISAYHSHQDIPLSCRP